MSHSSSSTKSPDPHADISSSSAERVLAAYLFDLFLPATNEYRAAYGIAPEPPRSGPPVTAEEAHAAAVEYFAPLRAEQAETEAQKLAERKALLGHAEKPRRRQSIAKMVESAEKTGKKVTSVTRDDTTMNFDETKPSDASNPWLADLPKVKQ